MKTRLNLSALSLCILATVALVGCSESGTAGEVKSSAAQDRAPQAASNEQATKSVLVASSPAVEISRDSVARQVIREGDLSVRVDNVEKAEKDVTKVVNDAGGFVESTASSDLATQHAELRLALKIPAPRFEVCIQKFEEMGVRTAKTIRTQDVTRQIIDFDARLKALRQQEADLKEMIAKSTRVDEKFNWQSNLTSVRGAIEATTLQRKMQADQAAMSSLQLILQQGAATSATDPRWFSETIGEAASVGGMALRAVIAALIWAITFSPFWVTGVILYRKFGKRPRVKPSPASV